MMGNELEGQIEGMPHADDADPMRNESADASLTQQLQNLKLEPDKTDSGASRASHDSPPFQPAQIEIEPESQSPEAKVSEYKSADEDRCPAEVPCGRCGEHITSRDWDSGNIRQFSIGLVHAQCRDKCKLVLTNCARSLTANDLRSLFSKHGRVLDASVDSAAGMALIEFERRQSADSAKLALDGMHIVDRQMSIRHLVDSEDHSTELQRREEKSIVDNLEVENEDFDQNELESAEFDFEAEQILDRDAISKLSARQMALMLVPNPKLNRIVYKQWMRLILGHSTKVAEFLFDCKANRQGATVSDFVSVPQHLSALLEGEGK